MRGVEFGSNVENQRCYTTATISDNAGTIQISSNELDGTAFTSGLSIFGSDGQNVAVTAGTIWNVEINTDTTASTH